MIVRLQKIEPTAGDHALMSHAPSAELPMIADHVNSSSLSPVAGTHRRLRNWLILANVIMWALIVLAVRLIFF